MQLLAGHVSTNYLFYIGLLGFSYVSIPNALYRQTIVGKIFSVSYNIMHLLATSGVLMTDD